MEILIPGITNAKNIPEIKVLTVEKEVGRDSDDLVKLCKEWNLSSSDVKVFFQTAKPFVYSMELNAFNVYNCNIKGNLLLNGVQKNYSINLGGTAFIYDSVDEQGYGCRKGKCLNYVYYQKFEQD